MLRGGGLWISVVRLGNNAVDYNVRNYSYKHRGGMEAVRSLLHGSRWSIVLAIKVLGQVDGDTGGVSQCIASVRQFCFLCAAASDH